MALKNKKLIFFSALLAVLVLAGVWYLIKSGHQEVITQTLKVIPVYGADQGPGGGEPCINSNDCSSWPNEICYLLEPRICSQYNDCLQCGFEHDCRNLSPYGNVCWGGPDAQHLYPCGVCDGKPNPAVPQTCNDIMPTPTFRYSILNPAGTEKAYISAEGYLVMSQENAFWPNYSAEGGVEGLLPNFWCDGPPAGSLIIQNNEGQAVLAFVACGNDSKLDFWADGPLVEFAQNDYSGSNNFVIKNTPFNDMTAAWVDNSGSLHLKACRAEWQAP